MSKNNIIEILNENNKLLELIDLLNKKIYELTNKNKSLQIENSSLKNKITDYKIYNKTNK